MRENVAMFPLGHINESIKTIRRLIGEDIDVTFIPQDDLFNILFDPTQMDQILFNLAVNARDAMPDGGILIITTKNTEENVMCPAGQKNRERCNAVLLSISDNGTGMGKETLANIFEPFYTTKEIGKGTGLGLATVHGIVEQNMGSIRVYSEPQMGTTFKIYIPVFSGKHDINDAVMESASVSDTGTILLVEDEAPLLKMTKLTLEKIGYTVHTASNGYEALILIENIDGPIDLLLTDVIMPGMNGKQLSERFLVKKPGTAVLFMSGYTDEVIEHRGLLEKGVNFILKPFNRYELAAKIRACITVCVNDQKR